jgi:hypothetical protein
MMVHHLLCPPPRANLCIPTPPHFRKRWRKSRNAQTHGDIQCSHTPDRGDAMDSKGFESGTKVQGDADGYSEFWMGRRSSSTAPSLCRNSLHSEDVRGKLVAFHSAQPIRFSSRARLPPASILYLCQCLWCLFLIPSF